MALTITTLRNAKPKAKPYKLADEKGLFLLVQPSGGMLWRMKYRIDGRDDSGQPKRIEKKLALGAFPAIGLKDARDARDAARRLLAKGIDPAEQKRRDTYAAKVNAANSFSALAKLYIAKNRRDGLAEATVTKREWFLRLVEKSLGSRPIADIQPFEILEAVRPYEAAKNDEKAHRTLQFVGQVFRYAVACQMAPSDPTRDLRGALVSRKPKHLAAILDAKKAGELLRAIDGYEGHPLTLIALKLSALLFVRPGELRRAEWSEFDLDAALWTIPATKMKARREHAVPLSEQAIALIREAAVMTAGGRYVFPSVRTPARPMSENTVNAALRRLGFTGDEMTAHGFRAMASTLLNESGKWSPDAIERALAHKDKDGIRAAYHRGAHWAERVEMAQWWADHLDLLRKGAEIVPFRPSSSG
ncbi:tyrosine-type recombinase/integrase [Rhizorhabdus wittichii]|uniref:Tyrosine-type recombinase/integrase n=1 Tax=Rhizorhabdus wittichii TaxID=160791 RepID=A0A975D784_9SPHN|nr:MULTISPECIES: site-specific integrase [Sphingomonadaceae]QTH23576.1 tyrosine-type recombinase/integrase [Rhizorhabdus wittichii]